VYIAWEGGGSQRRRSLYSEYKMNRKPERLNRFYGDDIPESNENEKKQLVTLLAMLKCLPVCQLYVADCEGDDVVAYLCCRTFRDANKVVASSDKDMYQLLNDRTRIYNFHKRTYVLKDDVFETFRVTASNFAIAKALCGDKGDNVPGVKGIGFKTVSKLYPFLGTDTNIILQDVFDYAAAHVDESKLHQRVLDNQEDVRRNWKLVYLDGGMISATQAGSIDHVVSAFEPSMNRYKLLKMIVNEGIGDFDIEGLCYAFGCIEGIQNRT
jgi:DNA polymerase-1